MSDSGIYQDIGGTAGCRAIAARFYARVARNPVLRPFFPGKSMRCAIEAFSAFLVQFFGGPEEDRANRHWLSLRESHRRFPIGPKERDAWITLMRATLEEADIPRHARTALLELFEQSSAYIAGQDHDSVGHPEMAVRWKTQRTLDDTVEAVRSGDMERAIALAGSLPPDPSLQVGVLAMMIRHRGFIGYVRQRLREDAALVSARYNGRTLLHAAAAAGCLPIVDTLLELGADPNALDGGDHAPLYSAGNECLEGGADVIRALVRAGADVNANRGSKRCTALHMAARRGNVELAAALLDSGANPNARDIQGVTPRGRAINCRKPAVAALLTQWGGPPGPQPTPSSA